MQFSGREATSLEMRAVFEKIQARFFQKPAIFSQKPTFGENVLICIAVQVVQRVLVLLSVVRLLTFVEKYPAL